MEQVEHLAAPPLDGATAVLALIERVALDPGADVEKLDRIVAMYERVKAKEAELAFWWTPKLGQKLGRLKRESRRLSFPGYAARSLLLDAITFLS